MTDTANSGNLSDRVTALEIDMQDIKLALNQLIDYTYQSQRQTNLQTQNLQTQMQATQTQMREMMNAIQTLVEAQRETFARIDEMQAEVRGLQTENRRMWEFLTGQLPPDDPMN